MKVYRIINIESGADLGLYEGATPEDALDSLARDAGYNSAEEARAASGDDGSNLRVEDMVIQTFPLPFRGHVLTLTSIDDAKRFSIHIRDRAGNLLAQFDDIRPYHVAETIGQIAEDNRNSNPY